MMAISAFSLVLLDDTFINAVLNSHHCLKADRLNAFADELLKFFLDGNTRRVTFNQEQ
jgi:hypothetical protein